MEKSNANKRIYTFSILVSIFVGVYIVTFEFVDDLYITLWIFIPSAIVLGIVGWIITKPIKEELKKGRVAEAKVKDSLSQLPLGMRKLYVVLSYTLSISWLIIGLLLLGIILFTSLSGSVAIGIGGAIFLILGIIAFFAARGISKGKKWGVNFLLIALLIFFLLIVSYPFFLR